MGECIDNAIVLEKTIDFTSPANLDGNILLVPGFAGCQIILEGIQSGGRIHYATNSDESADLILQGTYLFPPEFYVMGHSKEDVVDSVRSIINRVNSKFIRFCSEQSAKDCKVCVTSRVWEEGVDGLLKTVNSTSIVAYPKPKYWGIYSITCALAAGVAQQRVTARPLPDGLAAEKTSPPPSADQLANDLMDCLRAIRHILGI
jgi:hypothetical protein